MGGISDVINSSALVPQIRTRYPDAEIVLWCSERAGAMAPLIPDLDRVEHGALWRNRSLGGAASRIAQMTRTVRRMRAGPADFVLMTSAPWQSAMAVAASGAVRRVAIAERGNARWLTDVLPASATSHPTLAGAARLLEPLGIALHSPLQYRLDAQPLGARRERFRALLGARPVALDPFARTRGESIPLERWIRVAIELVRRGYDPLWIGSTRELREVHRAVGSAAWKYVDKLGDGTLADAAAAISLARLFVGHESAALHAASAFGVPTVGIYTPGDPVRHCPQGGGESRLLVRSSSADVTHLDVLAAVD
ncbi:MAG: glycosyltransferase family 9 protein, partial [Geodermatophilaceae bacterium]|nr:glycosyltransferase family 9 protein [Geodermatophilaceae bacterium]